MRLTMEAREDFPDGCGRLYQDARWPGSARLIYGVVAAPLWGLGIVHVLLHGITVTAALSVRVPRSAVRGVRVARQEDGSDPHV